MINLSVFLISLSALSYEILLVRLLSIERWHDFVIMIIGLALLGHGASGTFLYVTRKLWKKNLGAFSVASACDFSLSAFFCLIFSQMIPFNPMDFLWNPKQFFYLMGLSGVL
ncbi:MAG: SAM-dependent methyltransferase, partial [Bdellovibrionota bacterium]|nr:SAM-dependent methyltransferase [Bdellovibrionota bacterium]